MLVHRKCVCCFGFDITYAGTTFTESFNIKTVWCGLSPFRGSDCRRESCSSWFNNGCHHGHG